MELIKPRFDRGILALVLILTGCSGARVMMPTPNVHLDSERDFYGELHRELKNAEVPITLVPSVASSM